MSILNSVAGIVATGLGAVAVVFAGLFARQRYTFVKKTMEQGKNDHAALDQAGNRLDEVRQAPVAPVDTQGRTDFERRP